MGKTTLKGMTLTSKQKLNDNLQPGVLYFVDEGKEVRLFQENTLPEASSRLLENIYQYTGETNNKYRHGCFYRVIKSGENYIWREVYGLNLDLSEKTDEDTVEVHYDSKSGKLYCAGGKVEDATNLKVFESRYEFPSLGDPKNIYIDRLESSTYIFDEVTHTYVCIGRDYNEIKIIDGGNANA